MPAKKPRKWVATVTTNSTHPPPDLFTRTAATIARTLASKKVSPKGPTSGLRMLIYFINRAGKGLTAARRRELEKAKALLSSRIQRADDERAASKGEVRMRTLRGRRPRRRATSGRTGAGRRARIRPGNIE